MEDEIRLSRDFGRDFDLRYGGGVKRKPRYKSMSISRLARRNERSRFLSARPRSGITEKASCSVPSGQNLEKVLAARLLIKLLPGILAVRFDVCDMIMGFQAYTMTI